MARRHLHNPREGESQGHGREIRELRALRNQVRDLQRQVDDLSARCTEHQASARMAAATLAAVETAPSRPSREVRPAGLLARVASAMRALFAQGGRNE